MGYRHSLALRAEHLGRQVERDRVWAKDLWKDLCEPRVMNTGPRIGSSEPQVSVVIPCYNQAEFLGETIESAISQTYRNVEIVVIDDGSTDHLPDVVAKYPTVRCIRQNNQGSAGAHNRGLRESTGTYVIFLHGDDKLLPTAVEAGLDCFRTHPESAFVFGRY